MTGAAKLKEVLLEGLASGKQVHVDLERLEDIDVTLLQLLWVAATEREWPGDGLVSGVSQAAVSAARDAGFDPFPGLTVRSEGRSE